jgi:hypothetical protein
MFALYKKDTRTDNERYLQDELDRVREQQEREEHRRDQERKDRESARREEREYASRQADDWPDALQKQIHLCNREVFDGVEEEVGNFFGNTVAACEKAVEIWREVEASKQAQIDDLQRQIVAIQDSIRTEVADKLDAADQRREFAQVAQQIRDDQLGQFLDW